MQSSSASPEILRPDSVDKEAQPNSNSNVEYPVLDPPASLPQTQPGKKSKTQPKLTKQVRGVVIVIDDPDKRASHRERQYSVVAGISGLALAVALLIAIVLAICLSINWNSQ